MASPRLLTKIADWIRSDPTGFGRAGCSATVDVGRCLARGAVRQSRVDRAAPVIMREATDWMIRHVAERSDADVLPDPYLAAGTDRPDDPQRTLDRYQVPDDVAGTAAGGVDRTPFMGPPAVRAGGW